MVGHNGMPIANRKTQAENMNTQIKTHQKEGPMNHKELIQASLKFHIRKCPIVHKTLIPLGHPMVLLLVSGY